MGNLSARAWRTAAAAALAAGLLAGCARGPTRAPERDRLVAELADALREQALGVEDPVRRERLVTGLIQLRDLVWRDSVLKAAGPVEGEPDLPAPPGGLMPAPAWAVMFAPRSLVIGFFTQSKNFDEVPGPDGLEVRLQPLDQFGDPTKAVGSYRIEVFTQRRLTGETRGRRLGHWFVSVLDAEANRRYYDPVDRSYVFPLLWDRAIEPGTPVIVQATYYPPGGFTEKLFAQRLIRIGGPEKEEAGTEPGEAGASAPATEATPE
ncbi:MAG: hypothetical protein R6X20_03955 [Phycisphaerae bacterium]